MKISSLNKLSDIRSNRPGLTLLHYVAGQAEESNPELLTLPDDFALLEEAAKTPLDILQVEINKLETQINKIEKQMESPAVAQQVRDLMSDFLPYASSEVGRMKEAMAGLNQLQVELADFFCEDAKTFKIEDCFKSLCGFCGKFKQAVGENAKRREQEALAEQRRIQREAEELKKRHNNGKVEKCFCSLTKPIINVKLLKMF